MLFNSYIFILLFLPLTFVIYFWIYMGKFKKNRELTKIILAALSTLFYLYAGLAHFVLFMILCVGNILFYRLMQRIDKQNENMRKGLLFFSILANLAILFYYKYYNFFVDNINFLFRSEFSINEGNMPLGISFITFQNIAFLVDVYRRDVTKCSIWDYVFYVMYFPKVSSGPITRFQDLIQTEPKQDKEEFWDNIASGFYLFVMGLGKKVLIADMLSKMTDAGYACASELNSPTALLVSLAYTFQIYFDFSGYSDMAIGVSRMLQIKLSDNFNSPYKARDIEDFWDRWHISLTIFFTQYLYIPLGGNRKGTWRTYINILIVFLCSGLWHGASWTFIIWGGMHGVAMLFNRRFRDLIRKTPKAVTSAFTFLFVNFAWIVFRAGDFHTLKEMVCAIIKGGGGEILSAVSSTIRPEWLEKMFSIYIPDTVYIIGIFGMLGILVFICQNAKERADKKNFTIYNAIGVLAIFMICLLSFTNVTNYIYVRF